MNILIDIGHPAHVHLFRHFTIEMQNKGHKIFFTCREKEFEIYLLEHFGFPYSSFGKKYKSISGKILGMIKFDIKEFFSGLRFKPDLLLSHGSIYAAHASFLLRKPHISFEDTYNHEQIRLYKPFTDVILTSDYEHPLRSEKLIRYSGYHELAYLHPKRFSPDKNILKRLSINENDKYAILRFVSWSATHDLKHKGISFANKLEAIRQFSKYAKVFISSEAPLPEELKKYQIPIAPHKIHDAISFACLLFGESSTMAEEAAILGVPSIYLNVKSTYCTLHLEKDYHLIFNYSESEKDQHKAIDNGTDLLKQHSIKAEWKKRKDNMLSKKIDVTAYMVWFIENYPDSKRIMKENPDYQLNFI